MRKILIVEDDFISRKLLNRLLLPFGECDQAAGGHEALEAFRIALEEWKPYQLICLDIMLPDFDGQVVLKEIRQMEAKNNIGKVGRSKIVMTTALADKDNVINAMKAECDGYLVKPILRDKLLEKLVELEVLTEEEIQAAYRTP
jgi:two-component system, chemotaxis family, chemotaxis protein CheY